jgi:hypothetical protein
MSMSSSKSFWSFACVKLNADEDMVIIDGGILFGILCEDIFIGGGCGVNYLG